MSRFQQETRLLRTKIVDIERKIDEKKAATTELKKEFERVKTNKRTLLFLLSFSSFELKIKSSITDLLSRFESLETSYFNKEEELRNELSTFIFEQTHLARTFRRDVEELKRMQQEYMSKLDVHLIAPSFDELIQEQINKFYCTKDDEDDDEYFDNEQKFISQLNKLHDEHVLWVKKNKKTSKTKASIQERFRMFDWIR